MKFVTVCELERVNEKTLADINKLLPQLSESAAPLSLEALGRIVESRDTHLVVAGDGGHIIGMAVLVVIAAPTGKRVRIEDVVVDESQRGKGLGRKLIEELIAIAKREDALYMELTSRPLRVAANVLYQQLGFRRKETNAYVLPLV